MAPRCKTIVTTNEKAAQNAVWAAFPANGYARNSARSASRAGFGFAPMTVLTTSPPRNTFIAGMEVIWYFIAIWGLSSTLSLTILIFEECSAAIASRIGETARHGPHHSAQKSTMIVSSEF